MAESPLLRNVFLRDAAGTLLGGLWQQGTFTNSDFINMAAIFLVVPAYPPYGIFPRRDLGQVGNVLEADDLLLEPGEYVVLFRDMSPMDVGISDEPLARRVYSVNTSGRTPHFTSQVRDRDKKCVITGVDAIIGGLAFYRGFDAAHIFPLALESLWIQYGYGNYISDSSSSAGHSASKINSIQNGLLLRRDLHSIFDAYELAINPDTGYKVYSFGPDVMSVSGRILDPVCRDPNDVNRVSDHLLRWHFRQAVLCNMRGAGELAWEHDFPPGSDVMGEILGGPMAAERMEVELAGRLRAAG